MLSFKLGISGGWTSYFRRSTKVVWGAASGGFRGLRRLLVIPKSGGFADKAGFGMTRNGELDLCRVGQECPTHSLFVAKSFDGIEACGLARGIEAEKDADCH